MVRDNSGSSIILDVCVHILMLVVLIATLYPVLHVASISLSSPTAISQNLVTFFPRGININAYITIFKAGKVPTDLMNSVYYTIVGTLINLLLTITIAYPISKKNLPFKNFFMFVIMVSMFFNGGLVPTFLLVNKLGLYDSIWAIVLPVGVITYNLLVMRTFFQNIPAEMEESAFLDGAHDFQVLFHIALPLSKAAIATVGLFYAVMHWNNFFSALIYLKTSSKYPLQLVLREIVLANQMAEELAQSSGVDTIHSVTSESIKYATLFVSIIPMLIVYPFIQKQFVSGVMLGSLKG